ncbi:hypothetical protein ACET3Z_026288 [Daucus carota]
MAVKQAEDFKAAAKKAIYEAGATKKCYKIGLSNFVAYLATSEGRSLGDYVNQLIEEIPHDNRAPVDAAVDMAGLKGDRAIKDEPPDYHLTGFAENVALQEEEDKGQPGDHLAMHVLEINHHSLHIHSPQVISLSSNNHLERLDLKVKLEKATKQAESVETYAKKAINDAHDAQASGKKAIYKAVASTTNCYKICLDNFVVSLGISGEDKSLEDHVKLEKATKQAESVETYAEKAINDAHDAQASGKKAIYKAVASTTNCYKICLDNFVVSLGISGEDKSLEDHVSKLVKAIPFHARAPADMAVEVPGQEGDVG